MHSAGQIRNRTRDLLLLEAGREIQELARVRAGRDEGLDAVLFAPPETATTDRLFQIPTTITDGFAFPLRPNAPHDLPRLSLFQEQFPLEAPSAFNTEVCDESDPAAAMFEPNFADVVPVGEPTLLELMLEPGEESEGIIASGVSFDSMPASIQAWMPKDPVFQRLAFQSSGPGGFMLSEIFRLKAHLDPDGLGWPVEEKAFLQAALHRALRGEKVLAEDGQVPGFVSVYDTALALQDFAAFDQLQALLDQDGYSVTALSIAHVREDYAALARTIERKPYLAGPVYLGGEDDPLIVAAEDYILQYAAGLGFSDVPSFAPLRTATDLLSLADSFDVVVPIAGGGLSTGAVAHLLGFPVRVVEVHAHNREVPESRIIDNLEDVRGRRVLLADKDTVTAASILETIRILQEYEPAEVLVYLNLPLSESAGSRLKAVRIIEDMGVQVYLPDLAPAATVLEAFYKLNENLGTKLGRLRTAVGEFRRFVANVEQAEPAAAGMIREFVREQEELFFALNQLLPGNEEVREQIVWRLEQLLKHYREAEALAKIMTPQITPLEYLVRVIGTTEILPAGTEDRLAAARYLPAGQKYAVDAGVENEHIPHSYLAAFHNAQRALRDYYDVALIVGPEGFAYEPFFRDLGIATVEVNIPEADFGGARSLTAFGDLTMLAGRRVLVVEDDVQSGKTLEKVLEALQAAPPAELGLYLGSPAPFQLRENIPPAFADRVYVTEPNLVEDVRAFWDFLSARESIFKRTFTPASWRTIP